MNSALKQYQSELEIVQNPALGSYLIWQFGLGYQSESFSSPSFPLAFIVLPLLLHKPTYDLIASTNRPSGLGIFAGKLNEERENLFAIHERTLKLRNLTLKSLSVAEATELVSIDYALATFRANNLENEKVKKPVIPERLKNIQKAADKLGFWCSKQNLQQIALTLRVEF